MNKQGSIRSKLIAELGITKYEADELIKVYAQNHGGKVNPNQIVKDINQIAYSMINEVGYIYNDYDIRHEIRECGKDRVEDGIMSLLSYNEDRKLAYDYLRNRYADTVSNWSGAFYHAAQKQLLEILNGDISAYRNFVSQLPYHNINRVASVFDIENEVAKFLALNGTSKDFYEFMIDVEPVRDSEKLKNKTCPIKLSDKIFKALQESIKDGNFITFDRGYIMNVLSVIHNDKVLATEEKKVLQDRLIPLLLEGKIGVNFVKLAKINLEEKFNTLNEYLNMKEKFETNERGYNEYEAECQFLNRKLLPILKERIEKKYKSFIDDLETELNQKTLTSEKFKELKNNTIFSDYGENEIKIVEHKESEQVIVYIEVKNPITKETIYIELDGTRLRDIIKDLNKQELNRTIEGLDSLTKQGIGEISILELYSSYIIEKRFEYSKDREELMGVLSEKENSPYIVGGKWIDGKLTDLQVKVPYYVISNTGRLSTEILEMTPEQIQEFNRYKEIEVTNHSYTYGRIDGYYERTVYNFEINGEKYHIKTDDWTNGGWYTVIWKGESLDYPDNKAMGLSSSRSEWARCQSGVKISEVIKFISKNPIRFSEFYKEIVDFSDSCGRYPAPHIETFCKSIMKLPAESQLRKELVKENVRENKENELKNMIEFDADLEATLEKAEEFAKIQEKKSNVSINEIGE